MAETGAATIRAEQAPTSAFDLPKEAPGTDPDKQLYPANAQEVAPYVSAMPEKSPPSAAVDNV
jgi:hypothetical protein